MTTDMGTDRSTPALVTTFHDMAKVLFQASACSAAAYALASHEEACEHGDPERIDFWEGVCRELEGLRDQLDRAA